MLHRSRISRTAALPVALALLPVLCCLRVGYDVVADGPNVSPGAGGRAAPTTRDDGGLGGNRASSDGAVIDRDSGAAAYTGCMPACANAHGTASCVRGSCVVTCANDYADCDGDPNNGCETSLLGDPLHCGSCSGACDTTTCVLGDCLALTCESGFGECDGDLRAPCETDLNTSVEHCGHCYNRCPDNDGTEVCSGGACSATCDVSGTYSVKLTIPVTWRATQYIKAGSGETSVWGRLQLAQSGTSLRATFTECGSYGPRVASSSLSGEYYRLTFPNQVFDTPTAYMPPVTTTSGTLSSTTPNASFSFAPAALLMGATLADPINDPWPTSASQLSELDMDEDGKPAVTGIYANSDGELYPPVSARNTDRRADETYGATRYVFSLDGTLAGCAPAAGTANVTHANLRIFGCIRTTTAVCTSTEADVLDSNVPAWEAGTASYTLVRMAEVGTCADVRAASP